MTEVMTFRVTGMSCDHCRHAIEEEVGRVAGVTGVEVDLAAKTVTVRGHDPDEHALRAAIDEAGYEAE
jgi:copper ion binding protein